LLEIDLMGSPISQGGMQPLPVVKQKIFCQALTGIQDHRIVMKINFFILYRSPKTFHENIVIHPTTAIHANANLYLLKMTDELHTGELNPLVCIKDLGLGRGRGSGLNNQQNFVKS
jgi:hypothetical protein